MRYRLGRFMWGLMRGGLCGFMKGINEIWAVLKCRYV